MTKKLLLRSLLYSFCSLLSIAPQIALAQTWEMTGSLNEPRRLFTTNLLPDGRVLVAGGYDQNNTAMASCEVYDPVAGTWSFTDSLSVARAVHTATLLPDGRIVVIGGEIGVGGDYIFPVQTDVVEIFDPSTMTWSDAGHSVMARQNHTSILLPDTTIFIAGGDVTGNIITPTCEIFDPKTDSSWAVALMDEPRHDHQAALLSSGSVLITGGRSGGTSSTYYSDCEEYDYLSNTWTTIQSMPEARIAAILAAFSDSTVLSAGGRNAYTSTTAGSEVLDPVTSLWDSTDAMKLPCTWSGNVLFPSDRYIVTGGFIDANWIDNRAVVTTSTCEWYDRPNKLWYYAPQMNIARCEHGSAFFISQLGGIPKASIIVAGGMVGANDSTFSSTITPTCEILDVSEGAIAHYKAMKSNASSVGKSASLSASLTLSVVANGGSAPTLILNSPRNERIALELFTVTGVRVAEVSLTANAGKNQMAVSSLLPGTGVYFARAVDANASASTKIILDR